MVVQMSSINAIRKSPVFFMYIFNPPEKGEKIYKFLFDSDLEDL